MIRFTPWRNFHVKSDNRVKLRFMKTIAQEAENYFKKEMVTAKSGVVYYRAGKRHKASAPGEFPASETGRLRASISSRFNIREAVVGSNMSYSRWLREGTQFMQRRKMSDDALKHAMQTAKPTLRGFIGFRYGKQ